MDLPTLLTDRRMTRSFTGDPVDLDALARSCALALRAPTAGNCGGVRMTIVGSESIADYVERATDAEWRAASRRVAGLARAGALVVVTSRPADYAARYAEPDKAASGLADPTAWPVPYWHGDAGMATMALLLLVQDAGLGTALWGNFRHDARVLEWLGAPEESLFATVFVGHPDRLDPPSSSLRRAVPAPAERVRRRGA